MKKKILLIYLIFCSICCCFAKEKIFSSNDTQETIIKIMKKEHWNLVEEKMNGLDYVNKSIKENKNKFSAIWNFEKFVFCKLIVSGEAFTEKVIRER